MVSDNVKDQLLVTIQKTFSYNRAQAQQIFLMVMECMKKRSLVRTTESPLGIVGLCTYKESPRDFQSLLIRSLSSPMVAGSQILKTISNFFIPLLSPCLSDYLPTAEPLSVDCLPIPSSCPYYLFSVSSVNPLFFKGDLLYHQV